jgi:hypothetical protein
MSPWTTPSSAGFSSCCVWFAFAIGAGLSVETGLRASTSKRGIGVEKSCTPNRGLGGRPVGMLSAHALPTNGLRPFFIAIMPPAVNNPHLISSRRLTLPSAMAFRISRRLRCAFSASLSRAFDAFSDRNIDILSSSVAALTNAPHSRYAVRLGSLTCFLTTVSVKRYERPAGRSCLARKQYGDADQIGS